MSTRYTILKSEETGDLPLVQQFASDVLHGLSHHLKTLPCKYIYDERGCELFCQIMELPEYYLTRCETEVLETHKESIGKHIGNEHCNLVELGAGDGKKTKILLDQFRKMNLQFRYCPVDIAENAVFNLSSELKKQFPDIMINGLVAEYFDGISWLSGQNHGRNVVLFLGSNIGNFAPDEADAFLKSLWDALNDGDLVLIGFDLRKDIDMIVRAYNDTKGVTKQFNLNILERINRELGGNFDLRKFRYHCTWDISNNAVKSFLVSTCDQIVSIEKLDRSFFFRECEHLHTESSHKFSEEDLTGTAEKNGFTVIRNFYDQKQHFIDSLWQVKKRKI